MSRAFVRSIIHAWYLAVPTVIVAAISQGLSWQTVTVPAVIVFSCRLVESLIRSLFDVTEGTRYRWAVHALYGVIAGVAAAGFDVTWQALVAAAGAGAIRAMELPPMVDYSDGSNHSAE